MNVICQKKLFWNLANKLSLWIFVPFRLKIISSSSWKILEALRRAFFVIRIAKKSMNYSRGGFPLQSINWYYLFALSYCANFVTLMIILILEVIVVASIVGMEFHQWLVFISNQFSLISVQVYPKDFLASVNTVWQLFFCRFK